MAHLDISRSAFIVGTAADRLFHRVSGVASAAIAWNNERRTRNVLTRLSAHELDDIGLTRGDIDAIARKGWI